MTFTVEAGLLALGAVPLIVVWHLKRLWHRRVVVASLEPWRLAVTAASRPRRVPRTVLLALHLAVSILAGLAAAGPRLGDGSTPGEVAVIVDASASMAAGRRWDRAVAAATGALRPGSTVTVVRAGAHPRVEVLRGQGRAGQAAIESIIPGDVGGDLSRAVAMAEAVAGGGARITVVTDRPAPSPLPPGVAWLSVARSPELDNVAVIAAGVWTPGPGVPFGSSLFARVANFGRAAAAVPFTVTADDAVVASDTLRLGPGQGIAGTWSLPLGARAATLVLDPGDANPGDDFVVAPVAVQRPRVQLVGPSPAMAKALAALGTLEVAQIGRAQYFTDGRADLSVFAGRVPEAVPSGGVIIMAPPAGTPFTDAGGEAFVTLPARGEHPLVAGIDFEAARVASPAGLVVPPWGDVVLQVGDRVLAFAGSVGESRVVVFGFDPDAPESSLPRRAAFLVLVARAVAWALPLAPALVSAGAAVPLPPGAFVVRGPAGPPTTAQAGFFTMAGPGMYTAHRGGAAPLGLTFGAVSGGPTEADLRRREAPEMARGGSRSPENQAALRPAVTQYPGRPVGPLLAAGAVGVLLVEGRWRSRGRGPRRGAPAAEARE